MGGGAPSRRYCGFAGARVIAARETSTPVAERPRPPSGAARCAGPASGRDGAGQGSGSLSRHIGGQSGRKSAMTLGSIGSLIWRQPGGAAAAGADLTALAVQAGNLRTGGAQSGPTAAAPHAAAAVTIDPR